MQYFFLVTLLISAIFLILLVLVQRGKGGGLAGAFGGMGGQSAFGTKAGDMFTKITVVTAAIWIILCILSVRLLAHKGEDRMNLGDGLNNATSGQSATPGETPPAETPSDEKPSAEAPSDQAPTGSGDKGAAEGGAGPATGSDVPAEKPGNGDS